MVELGFKYVNEFPDPWDKVKLAREDMTVFVPLNPFTVK
jgi:hypothetical protein